VKCSRGFITSLNKKGVIDMMDKHIVTFEKERYEYWDTIS